MKKIIPWLTCAILLVIIFGTLYTVVQQSQRSEANNPQIQIALDTANALNTGSRPDSLIAGRVNMTESLAPFIIIYNHSGQVVAGNGILNGSIPTVPFGVLIAARNKSYSSVTWQPQSSFRIAAVSVATRNYYVLSGRSLLLVENNENKTFDLSLAGGIASMLVLLVCYWIYRR